MVINMREFVSYEDQPTKYNEFELLQLFLSKENEEQRANGTTLKTWLEDSLNRGLLHEIID